MSKLYFPNIKCMLFSMLLFSSCSSTKWVDSGLQTEWKAAPQQVRQIFDQYPNSIMTIEAESPGYDYDYDIAEKDQLYGMENEAFTFETVRISLHDKMPEGKVLVDIEFQDRQSTCARVNELDLMRLIPAFETNGNLGYSEVLLEEYNRFGLSFRKEHGEFELTLNSDDPQLVEARERTYRMSITNNCLEPTKWEMALVTENYADFKDRVKSELNLNQNKLLSHSWFYLNSDLYDTLIKLKNPGLDVDFSLPYDSINVIAENTVVDFENLRYPLGQKHKTKILEIGHQSGRKLEPVDVEEHYKWRFGLLLNQDDFQTYTDILESPVKIARFASRGYYNAETPNIYDYGFLKHVDDVIIERIEAEESNCYVQITLTGEYSPFDIVLGNLDMAIFDEQKLTGFLFGYNTYPKSRRYNPKQNTLFYDTDSYPELLKPYILLVDKKTGKWVNNQKKGVEKVYISYESLNKDVLQIYLLSYERVTPIWMARVKLPTEMREAIRIRKSLYDY